MNQRKLAVLIVLVLTMSFASVAKAGSTYAVGDVFVAVSGVGVEEYTAAGVLVQNITDASITTGSTYITGMAFQNDGSLLVTGFSSGNVVQFNNSGTLTNATWTSGINAPESIAINAAGQVYVSSVGGTGITQYNSTGGAAIGTSIAGTRIDWIDLGADQKTMLYTKEDSNVYSVDVSTNTPNPNFATSQGGGHAALRIIATGAFAGDVLVSDESSGNPELLSAAGVILKTYTGGGLGTDFALNIDPNGTSFWTADTGGHVAEFDITTGALLESWNASALGGGNGTYGLVVFGQQTASGGGGGGTAGVPEPGTLALLVGGLFTLGGFTKRRLLK